MNGDNIQCDWIIDSGATNHRTYDPHDLACDTTLLQHKITNVSGVTSPVTRTTIVHLTSTLSLPNILLVPPLKHKLMSPG